MLSRQSCRVAFSLRQFFLSFVLLVAAGSAFAASGSVEVTTPPPASANAGSSFNVTAYTNYHGDCANKIRIVVSSGSCTGGSSSYTGNAACADSPSLTQSITMSAGALTACVISVDGSDNNVLNGQPASVPYTIKINQSIVWSGVPASSLMTSADYAIVATAKTSDGVADTGMAITYTSTTPAVCTVTAGGGVVHNVAVGTCTIQAAAASSANFAAVSSTATSWSVVKASQAITVMTPAPASAAYGSSFTVAATAPGGTVVVSTSGGCSNVGNNVTMTSGTTACTVLYNQAGNGTYNAASQVSSSTTASKATQTITVTTPAPANAAYGSSFTVAATAPGGAVVVSTSGGCSNVGNNVTMTSGTVACVVNYDQAGSGNYSAAMQVGSSTTASKATQTITVTTPAPANAAYGDNFTVVATASSGDSVAVTTSGGCSNVGNNVTMTSGTQDCVVHYNQNGNGSYDPAPQVISTTLVVQDQDIDGAPDATDNCPLVSNADQQDTDGDGTGDACDSTPNGDTDGDGIDNLTDNCPINANPGQENADGDSLGDACDPTPNGDTDGDGIDNAADNCPLVTNPTQANNDGDTEGDACDTDDDNDGILDTAPDNCPLIANANQADADLDGVGNVCDPDYTGDTDGDGIVDGIDNCPVVSNPLQENADGDSLGDVCDLTPNGDTDGDGIDNLADNCPTNANPGQENADGDSLGDVCDPTPNGDTDGDGIDNLADNCPTNANPGQENADGDSLGDVCDPTPNGDTDGDGVDNSSDNCPLVANSTQTDTDIDGTGDACDTTPTGDIDNDSIDNGTDNCPAVANADQLDTDGDGTGDVCDSTPNGDTDNDGIDNLTDNCPTNANPGQENADGDSLGDACDLTPNGDTDGDGIDNLTDNCPINANPGQENADGDSLGDACDPTPNGDTDGDGIDNAADNCPLVTNPTQANNDGDTEGDACDTDDDNDGILDTAPDNCPLIANANQADADLDGVGNVCDPDYTGDTDGDGIVDGIDNCPVVSNPLQENADGDSLGDVCDLTPNGDTDGDGIDNLADNCPTNANPGQENADGDSLGDVCDPTPNGDTDGDGIDNLADNCPTNANPGQENADGDSLGDVCDPTPNGDTDGDGVDNSSDNCPNDANPLQEDADNDGQGDACDPYPAEPGVLVRAWGEGKKDIFARAVANAGDVDGDGHDDVVVGAYLWDLPKTPTQKKLKDIGKVYVYSGKDGHTLHTFNGKNAGDQFGFSVAGADVNGDGYADIVVGAPRHDKTLPVVGSQKKGKVLKDAGAVYIYSGKPADNYRELQAFEGTAAGDNLGFAVANAGDVGGMSGAVDGKDDVVYSAPKADAHGLKDAGVVLVSSLDSAAALLRFEGDSAGDLLGSSVAGIADVNGDGHAEIVVGAYRDDVFNPDTGKLLKDAGSVVVYSGADGEPLALYRGENAGDWFGYSVAGAGDLNGDGKPDVVIGADRHDVINSVGKKLKDAGAVYAYTVQLALLPDRLLFKFKGQAAGDHLGYSVASGGDLDNDNNADVVAGAPGRDRTQQPPAGSKKKAKLLKDTGAVYGLDGSGVELFELKGLRVKDNYGAALANAGDVNLDGYSDIITATPKADTVNALTSKPIKDIGLMEVISGKIAVEH